MKSRPFSKGKQYAIGLFVLVSVVTFSALYLLESSMNPFIEAKEKAVEVARQYANISETTAVTIFNGKETYYNVVGKNKNGQDVYVLVPDASSEIFVYQTSEGISADKANEIANQNGASTIKKTVLGYAEGRAVWEVQSGTAYYFIDFKSGDLLKKEGL